ncbi:MAG: hydrogenase maturation protease [Chloroflexi bacterium]|nr:hydrogenase maturation protease [Chloroflexota bacterium]
MNSSSRTLIIGLGNPLLSDDGVGWCVAEELRALVIDAQPCIPQGDLEANNTPARHRLEQPSQYTLAVRGYRGQSLEIDTLAGGGLSLMERLVGYDRAILIDAMQSGQPVGTVRVFQLEELENPFAGHLGSTHETNLQTALEIGRQLNAHLPQPGAINVVAVEAQTVYDFSEKLSPLVAAAVPAAVQAVLILIKYNG